MQALLLPLASREPEPAELGLPLGLCVCEAALLREPPPVLLPQALPLPSRETLPELLP